MGGAGGFWEIPLNETLIYKIDQNLKKRDFCVFSNFGQFYILAGDMLC